MRDAIFVLCLVVFCVSTSGGLPLSSGGNISRIHRQNAQFGESVRDWFSRIKARILDGRGTNPKLEDPDKLGQGKFILIDLNTLKLNPRKDWGFRLGNWYYINHNDENPVKTLPAQPGGFNYDDLHEMYDDGKAGTEDLSAENGGEGEEQQYSKPLKPDEVSIRTESPNNAAKRDDENSIKGPQSAEVLAPKDYQE